MFVLLVNILKLKFSVTLSILNTILSTFKSTVTLFIRCTLRYLYQTSVGLLAEIFCAEWCGYEQNGFLQFNSVAARYRIRSHRRRRISATSWFAQFIVFTALHAMQTRSSDENSVRLSVCLSVTRVHCDKTVERSVQIFIPYERTFTVVF